MVSSIHSGGLGTHSLVDKVGLLNITFQKRLFHLKTERKETDYQSKEKTIQEFKILNIEPRFGLDHHPTQVSPSTEHKRHKMSQSLFLHRNHCLSCCVGKRARWNEPECFARLIWNGSDNDRPRRHWHWEPERCCRTARRRHRISNDTESVQIRLI